MASGHRHQQASIAPGSDKRAQFRTETAGPVFHTTRRTTWGRSLSIRGRESIVFAPWENIQPRFTGGAARRPRIPDKRLRKPAKYPPDFSKEKAYFEEVDAFDLLEESPSPKKVGTWQMGIKPECNINDLPAILDRWRIFKLVSKGTASQPRFSFLETPNYLPRQKVSSGPNDNCPTTTHGIGVPIEATLYNSTEQSKTSSCGNLDESAILSSLDKLDIKEVHKERSGHLNTPEVVECLNAFSQLLMVCKQPVPIPLCEVFKSYCDPGNIFKIGEGTYGEAFKAGDVVLKIVPIDGCTLVNGEIQKKSEEVLEEVLLSLTLNNLRAESGEAGKESFCTGFIETKEFRVCQGHYDTELVNAWEAWDIKHVSENDHPREFSTDQCYIVFLLADGGKDLESFNLLDYKEAQSLLLQVTVALAVAETACEFEHRDLHWGNVLLARDGNEEINFTIQGKRMKARTFGLVVSIIDFTLSRINTGEAVLFFDLSADPELFDGPKGDKQFETYRAMREIAADHWEESWLKTNVLWLSYLVDILLLKKSFRRTSVDERNLRYFKKRLNSYHSARDCLSDVFFSGLLTACDNHPGPL